MGGVGGYEEVVRDSIIESAILDGEELERSIMDSH